MIERLLYPKTIWGGEAESQDELDARSAAARDEQDNVLMQIDMMMLNGWTLEMHFEHETANGTYEVIVMRKAGTPRAGAGLFDKLGAAVMTAETADAASQDAPPAWVTAETDAERKRLMYEARAQIMGKKKAGIATYAVPRARAKRGGDDD